MPSNSLRDLVAPSPPQLSSEHLAGYRRTQRLAYDCAVQMESELREGVTERQIAARMDEYLRDHGVRQYFHRPFAWFGDRTAFRNFWTDLSFFPTRRALRPNSPVIVDVAPVLDGYAADIGYTISFGSLPRHERLMDDLAKFRVQILQGVRQQRSFAHIWREVDATTRALGYDNRHKRYPFRVLAHRVDVMLPEQKRSGFTVAGFGPETVRSLLAQAASAKRGTQHHSPLWNDRPMSEHPPVAGLWAVEPHLAAGPLGAKWEELLVIDGRGARWLDDDLPHHRRWREHDTRAA